MGICAWNLDAGFSTPEPVRTPRLTIRCEYPDQPPTEVTFGLSPHYGKLMSPPGWSNSCTSLFSGDTKG